MTQFAVVIAAFAALSLTVTKSVDLARNLFDGNATAPPVTWNVVALVIGVAYCLGWQIDLSAQVLSLVPALAPHSARLAGVTGQVLTGFLAGGGAGFFHELLDALSGVAKRARAQALATATRV